MALHYDRGDTTFERTPARTYGQPAPLDEDSTVRHAHLVGHPDRWRLLQARDLIAPDREPFTAALLLFGARPQRLYPEAYVRVLRYSGKERRTGTAQNLVSDVRYEGRLPQQIDAARRAVREALPKQKSFGPDGRFWVVRHRAGGSVAGGAGECVIHRAYSNFGDHIRITIFDDRVEVASPGRFPGVTSARNLNDVPRFARNPRIARVMADLSYGQELGEGLRRMAIVMESSGLRRPMLRQTAGGVEITLSGVRMQPAELKEMPPVSRLLYEQIVMAGRLRTGELINLTGHSRPRVLQYLYAMEARGLVRRVGGGSTDPHAYWTAE